MDEIGEKLQRLKNRKFTPEEEKAVLERVRNPTPEMVAEFERRRRSLEELKAEGEQIRELWRQLQELGRGND